MKKHRVFVTGFLAFVLLLSPIQTQAQVPASEAAYRATLIQLIQLLQQQIIFLQAEQDKQLPTLELTHDEVGKFTESVKPIAVYDIRSTADVSTVSNRQHREYFARVFDILPTQYDEKIGRVLIFDGEESEYDAYVETIPPLHERWLYAAREEIIKDEDSSQNAELIVHELAHIISYDEILGLPKPATANCEGYFTIHGCPAENSYLRQFVDTFWSASDLRRAEQFANAGDSFESAYAYYDSHVNDFVTDYAASSPEEDFSESFMFYVMGETTVKGTEARQKVDWFKDYPKLVEVRKEIISNL